MHAWLVDPEAVGFAPVPGRPGLEGAFEREDDSRAVVRVYPVLPPPQAVVDELGRVAEAALEGAEVVDELDVLEDVARFERHLRGPDFAHPGVATA